MSDKTIYSMVIRRVDRETGDISAEIGNSGTQEELEKEVGYWMLRARYSDDDETVYLVKQEFAELVRNDLEKRNPDYEWLEKFSAEVR